MRRGRNYNDEEYSLTHNDLPDPEEVEQLNREYGELELGEEEYERSSTSLLQFVVMVVLIAFPLFMLMSVLQAIVQPRPEFLSESQELQEDPWVRQLQSAVVRVSTVQTSVFGLARGQGTGFNVSSEGIIITNRHVVEGAGAVFVAFEEHGTYRALEPQYFPAANLDVAILELEGDGYPFVEAELSPALPVGDQVLVVGNPLGYRWVAKEGKVSGHMPVEGLSEPLLKIRAPIYKGSSGSPVFDKDGTAVGVIFAVMEEDGERYGLAIPLKELERFDPVF